MLVLQSEFLQAYTSPSLYVFLDLKATAENAPRVS